MLTAVISWRRCFGLMAWAQKAAGLTSQVKMRQQRQQQQQQGLGAWVVCGRLLLHRHEVWQVQG
jgi:hypothetical protein